MDIPKYLESPSFHETPARSSNPFPLARGKSSQWLEALQKPHLSQALCKTMLFLFKICHHNLHCLWNNKGLLGKNISYSGRKKLIQSKQFQDRNNKRWQEVEEGVWECVSGVFRQGGGRAKDMHLQSGGLVHVGALSCDLERCLLERKPGVHLTCC